MQIEQTILTAPSCIELCSLMRHVLPENRLEYLASLAERGLPIQCTGGHESQMQRVCDQPEAVKQAMRHDLQADRRRQLASTCIAASE